MYIYWPNQPQVRRKLQTSIDFQVCMAQARRVSSGFQTFLGLYICEYYF